jgi:hypothetical protein
MFLALSQATRLYFQYKSSSASRDSRYRNMPGPGPCVDLSSSALSHARASSPCSSRVLPVGQWVPICRDSPALDQTRDRKEGTKAKYMWTRREESQQTSKTKNKVPTYVPFFTAMQVGSSQQALPIPHFRVQGSNLSGSLTRAIKAFGTSIGFQQTPGMRMCSRPW